MLYKNAIAEGINERNIFLYDFADVKLGDGCISLKYSTDEPRKGSFGEEDYIVGGIRVYSNGYISCDVADERYKDTILSDYKEISGEQIDETKDPTSLLFLNPSKEKDPARWSKIKQFIADNNIELEYAEDLEAEQADYTKMPYEEDEEFERRVNGSDISGYRR